MKNSLFKLILIIIIFIFLCSYYISNSGYYEYELREKTTITNEKIKQFEKDLQNNKKVDLVDYLDPEERNYSNKLSNMMYELSDNSNKLFRKCLKHFFKKINKMVEED